jgi:hypothetical protein
MATVYALDVVTVTLEIPIPLTVASDDVREWLRFNLGHTGGIDCGNPLLEFEPKPSSFDISYPTRNAI